MRHLLLHVSLTAAALGLSALAASPPAQAAPEGVSPWADDHASRLRLVGGAAAPDLRWAGIEIEMDEGYKTYWRTPGSSGIPPELDWSGSSNVADVRVEWPAPARFEDAFGDYYGYLEHVVIPIAVTPVDPSAPVTLSLSALYGVCKDICIPATAETAVTLPPAPIASDALVAGARDAVPPRVPLGEAEGPLAVLSVTRAGEDALGVRVRAPEGAFLLAEGPSPRWFLAPSVTADADGVFTIEIAERPRDAQGPLPLTLTLVGGGEAIEVEAVVE